VPRLLLWNPAPRRRDGIVVADLTGFLADVLVGPPGGRTPRRSRPGDFRPAALQGPSGPIPLQVLGRRRAQERMDSARHYPDQDEVEAVRVAFRAPALGGLEVASLEPASAAAKRTGGKAHGRGRVVENELVEALVRRDGTVRLTDRASGERYDGLLRFESGGDAGDTYTYAPPPRDRLATLEGARVRVLAPGPLVAALEITGSIRSARGRVDLRAVVSLHDGSPALRITVELDNKASDHRLRVRFPTGIAGGVALAGAAFGSERRMPVVATGSRHPLETPVATAPAHRFVALAGVRRGLALMVPGFFEYEQTTSGDLVMTILRAVGQLSRPDLATRPGHAGWPAPTPEAQSRGYDRLQLALSPVHAADLDAGAALPSTWEDVFLPPRAVWLRQASPLRIVPVGLELGGSGIVFSALKPAESGEGVVVRCYNASGARTAGWCRLSLPIASAQRMRADERGAVAIPVERDGRTVRFAAGGREIVTLLLGLPPSETSR
jgi:hypothetical protein